MSLSTAARILKEEVLQTVPSEVYAYNGSRKRKRPLKEIVVRPQVRKRRRTRRYRGRRVRAVVRPGTAVLMSTARLPAFKRKIDEVRADDDILAQQFLRQGEFLYGKRSRRSAFVPLDTYNPTPNLQPITEQQVLPVGRKRGLHPTAQILAPKRIKLPFRADKSENSLDVALPTPAGPVRAKVKVRPVAPLGGGVGVRTVDVEIPSQSGAEALISPAIGIERRVEPVFTPPVVETIAPPVESFATELMETSPVVPTVVTARRRRREYRPVSGVIPEAVYHPTIQHIRALPKRSTIFPAVQYHPTIDLPPLASRTTIVD